MKSTITYKRFFAYSEKNNKFFNVEFNDGINIVHGRNTSGKSTLIQSILYTFGINDEKYKLEEVLSEKVVFRLDFILKQEGKKKFTIIRDDEILVVKSEDSILKRFTGISGNSANEHKDLKEYLGFLFGFNLHLESSNEYKPASIEAMFLPYYVAQDVGWVYRHKSFRGLDFIKNFKFDFFDYYLGIVNDYDRDEKQILEKEKKKFQEEIKFLSDVEKHNDELELSKLKDEKYIGKATEYLEIYKKNKAKLISLEKEYLLECNKLAYYEQRKSVISKVKLALKKQNPIDKDCPTCNQSLPHSVEQIYEYFQDLNDTTTQLDKVDNGIKELKSTKGKINSLSIDISNHQELVAKNYSVLVNYKIEDLTLGTWIDNKTNVQLYENIVGKIGESTIKLNATLEKLKGFKTDEELTKERATKEYFFKKYFENNLDELGVKAFDNDRFLMLYHIPAFPKQGVELLKTLLAYNFAFNKIISETSYVHRFPLLLDAVFKEDLEDVSKPIILKFIAKNKPQDTQILMSIADSMTNLKTAEDYNLEFFGNKAKLIKIGNMIEERAFLSKYDNKFDDYLDETIAILNTF